MSKIHDLIFYPDLLKVTKDSLENIAMDYDIVTDRSLVGICSDLWGKMNQSEELRAEIGGKLSSRVFAGSTSVSWFLFPDGRRYFDEKKLPANIVQPRDEEIKGTPIMVGATKWGEDTFLLRFILRTGVYNRVSGFDVSTSPRTALISVVMSLKDDYIEVRSEPSVANKIIEVLRSTLFPEVEVTIIRFEDFSDSNIELWADGLKGQLIETLSHPEIIFESVGEEQVQAVLDVLSAINDYIATSEVELLASSLGELTNVWRDLSEVPLAALVLAGMDKVGLGTEKNKDLREQILFSLIRPHVRYLRGFIRFPVVEYGVSNYYTIRVGVTTKSVFFNSASTEDVIAAVREQVLKLE